MIETLLSLWVHLAIVVALRGVIDATEVANPARPIVNELDERVHVRSALLTPNDWLLVEVYCGYIFPRRQLSERLNEKGKRHVKVFLECVGVGDAISSDT